MYKAHKNGSTGRMSPKWVTLPGHESHKVALNGGNAKLNVDVCIFYSFSESIPTCMCVCCVIRRRRFSVRDGN